MAKVCGGCMGNQVGRTAAPASAWKVVDDDGRCLLTTPEGLCRMFADQQGAARVAAGEVGSSGWTVEAVLI